MRINFKIAQHWNDLSEWQIKAIGRFMFTSRNEQTETVLFKKVLLFILLLSKPNLTNIVKSVVLLLQVPFSELEQYTAFVFDQKELLTRFPNQIKIGRWPFCKKVYGPAPRLANTTIEELSYADTFYYKWMTENNPDDLHRLTAILYRPSREPTLEDKRIPFSSLTLESNSRITDAIPLPVKFMIAHAYYGCRQNFINRNPNVFPQKKAVEGEEEKKPEKPKPYQPFSKIIDAFAMDEVQIFGNHQQVEKVFAPKFLSIYEESIKREREKERQRNTK
jgi:hypothetical protein